MKFSHKVTIVAFFPPTAEKEITCGSNPPTEEQQCDNQPKYMFMSPESDLITCMTSSSYSLC